ncbi:MAG: hypothetical protein E7019_03305 [Alphaproteobacteria bacterium]|nr:hypothetical protein [Alphaproteobacteria bacterium]
MENLWWLAALISGMLVGVIIYLNQIFKMPSSLLMSYRGILTALLLLPFCCLFPLPQNPWFWILSSLQGLIVAYCDKKSFVCARVYGGEIVAALRPFAVAFVLVFWWFVSPSQFIEMLDKPIHSILIVLCIVGVMYSLFVNRTGTVSKNAFKDLLPALILYSVIDVNNKYANTIGLDAGLASSVYWYCFMSSLFAGLPNITKFLMHRDWKLIFVPKYMFGGLMMSGSIIILNAIKNPAMVYAPNPAYISAIMAAYPVWIIAWNCIYYRFKNAEKYHHCNFKAVTILLVSIISLILLQ